MNQKNQLKNKKKMIIKAFLQINKLILINNQILKQRKTLKILKMNKSKDKIKINKNLQLK